jgi:hypothetical protein
MKTLKLVSALAALLLASGAAFAGGTWTNVIVVLISASTSQRIAPDGMVEVELSANASGGATCGNSYPQWVTIDTSSSGGKIAASILKEARLTRQPVSVVGTGTCSAAFPSVEELSYVIE